MDDKVNRVWCVVSFLLDLCRCHLCPKYPAPNKHILPSTLAVLSVRPERTKSFDDSSMMMEIGWWSHKTRPQRGKTGGLVSIIAGLVVPKRITSWAATLDTTKPTSSIIFEPVTRADFKSHCIPYQGRIDAIQLIQPVLVIISPRQLESARSTGNDLFSTCNSKTYIHEIQPSFFSVPDIVSLIHPPNFSTVFLT